MEAFHISVAHYNQHQTISTTQIYNILPTTPPRRQYRSEMDLETVTLQIQRHEAALQLFTRIINQQESTINTLIRDITQLRDELQTVNSALSNCIRQNTKKHDDTAVKIDKQQAEIDEIRHDTWDLIDLQDGYAPVTHAQEVSQTTNILQDITNLPLR